jgi:hypothetical protein
VGLPIKHGVQTNWRDSNNHSQESRCETSRGTACLALFAGAVPMAGSKYELCAVHEGCEGEEMSLKYLLQHSLTDAWH